MSSKIISSPDINTAFVDHGPVIRRAFASRCGSIGIHDPEDLMQETFIRAYKAWDTFDPAQSSLRTWLFMIAHSVKVDTTRREVAYRQRNKTYIDRNGDVDIPGADEIVIAQTEGDEAMQAFNGITQLQRSALLPKILEDKTNREISEEQGVPYRTVITRQRDGLIALRNKLMASVTFADGNEA